MDDLDHDLRKELHVRIATDASLFSFLQATASGGIWYWDPKYPDQGWQSSTFWSLLGYNAKEKTQLAFQWHALIDTDDWQALCRYSPRYRNDPAHPYEQILKCRHKDGSAIWVRGRTLTVDLPGAQTSRILCTLEDLTSQKLAEAHLKNSPAFLKAVFNSIQDGISVLDRDLKIISVNRKMERWHAHKLPLEGKKCYSVYHGRQEPCDNCPVARCMQSGKLEMSEIPFIRHREHLGTLELYAFPMIDDGGQIEAVVEFIREITARKQAEMLLKEREQLFRALFEENHSAMLIVDPETGGIVDANPSACAFYGYPKSKLTGMRITAINIFSPEEVFEEMKRARIEERNSFDFRHRLADGTIRDVEVFSGPITIGGRSLLCSIIHDVSARKQMEKERENLIENLQKALSEVKTLRGFLPICASCKKIRDDKGYWNQIETYIRNHSEAEFSHSLCPECVRRLYPGINIKTPP